MDGNNAVSLAFELFSKLYDSRQMLDELRSVIPVLKDTIKKREQELMKKKARLSKLQPIVKMKSRITPQQSVSYQRS